MSYQPYYSDKHKQSQKYNYGTTTDHGTLLSQYDQSGSRSSDYISRPRYSTSDYISKPTSDARSTYSSYASCSSSSDYISWPVETRHEYISPRRSDHTPYSGDMSAYDMRDAHDSSRKDSHAHSFSSRSTYGREPSDCITPLDEKPNCQLIKEGGWDNKLVFMRSHGLKTWELDAFQEANGLLDKYRVFDAQSAYESADGYFDRSKTTSYGRSRPSQRESYYERQRYDNADTYTSSSDVASYRSGVSSSHHGSCDSSVEHSGIRSTPSVRLGSDYEEVYASSDEDAASDSTRSGSDYECRGQGMPFGSDYESIDGGESLDGSDYVSGNGKQDDVGPGGYASDDGFDDDYYMGDGYDDYDEGPDNDDY